MKRKFIEVTKNFFVDQQPIEDEACARDENDPASAFAQYIFPKLKTAKDEGLKEVLAFMSDGENLGDAIVYTIESLPSSKTRRLRALVDEANSSRIYAYVRMDTWDGPYGNTAVFTQGLELSNVEPRASHSPMFEEVIGHYHHRHSSVIWAEHADAAVLRRAVFAEFTSPTTFEIFGLKLDQWKGPGIYGANGQFHGTAKGFKHKLKQGMVEAAFEDLYAWPEGIHEACAALRNVRSK